MLNTSNSRILIRGFASVLLIFYSLALADRFGPETQYVEVAPDGYHFFVMLPAEILGDVVLPARGYAYKLERGGSFVSLWQVKGWYANPTFLAPGGKQLVRMGSWAGGSPEEQLAVAFYSDGQEQSRYSVADLLNDADSIERSVSHFRWESDRSDFPRLATQMTFQLLTVENVLITFDVVSGDIVDRRPYTN